MIPFSKTYVSERSQRYVHSLLENANLGSDGVYTQRCTEWLRQHVQSLHAMLTPSCTASLELAAMLCRLQPGDEVIMPSYTFPSCANAFVMQGATPVFVDIEPSTMNVSLASVEQALSPKTKAILAVHYAGMSCDMKALQELAEQHQCVLIEDCAQALGSRYADRPLGSFGALSCYSFHYTKNIIAGEAGAFLINDGQFRSRAEILREKGTNRQQFLEGQVDKYTWVDIGSSYLPSELSAAFLWGQLEELDFINANRMQAWQAYHAGLADLEAQGFLKRPQVPSAVEHNAHIYFILLNSLEESRKLQKFLQDDVGVQAHTHYVPLHSSPYGQSVGKVAGKLTQTEDISQRLLRLPLFFDMYKQTDKVIAGLHDFFKRVQCAS